MSLVETIIAIFFLLVGMTVATALFHVTFERRTLAGHRAQMALLAQRRLVDIRDWAAATSGGYNFDDWSSLADQTQVYPDAPGYTIRTRSAPRQLFSPSSELETGYPAAERRAMTASAFTVEITVRRDQLNYRLVSVVADPPRTVDVAVNGTVPSPVGSTDTAVFTTSVTDEFGNPVSDVFADWQILSQGGLGRWQSRARDGSTATFEIGPGGVAGQCRVEAAVRYDGVTIQRPSATMDLAP